MDTAQKLIQAIASLLWPLIVLFLLFRFKPALAAIIESAKSRKFTLKIGGQELTMEEANQVQQNLIADLQSKVSEIEKKLNPSKIAALVEPTESVGAPAANVLRVLWVDDNPKNNSYFVEQLSSAGVRIDISLTTKDGVALFNSRKYDYVISDMGRSENGNLNRTAGIDLLKLVRAKNVDVPFVIYCSRMAQTLFGQEALRLGATAVTSSPTELNGILNLQSLKSRF